MRHSTMAIKKLIQKLKEANFPKVDTSVFWVTDADYSENGIEIAQEVPLPHIYLVGPNNTRNALFTTQEKPTVVDAQNGRFKRFTAEEARDMVFQIFVMSDRSSVLNDLTDCIDSYFLNGKTIKVEKCPEQPAQGENEYEIDLVEKFVSGRMVNNSNLKEASASVIIRGVLFSDGEVFQEGRTAEVINLDLGI